MPFPPCLNQSSACAASEDPSSGCLGHRINKLNAMQTFTKNTRTKSSTPTFAHNLKCHTIITYPAFTTGISTPSAIVIVSPLAETTATRDASTATMLYLKLIMCRLAIRYSCYEYFWGREKKDILKRGCITRSSGPKASVGRCTTIYMHPNLNKITCLKKHWTGWSHGHKERSTAQAMVQKELCTSVTHASDASAAVYQWRSQWCIFFTPE